MGLPSNVYHIHAVTGVVGIGHRPGLMCGDLAAGFSGQSGRTTTFEALTPDAFAKLNEPMLGPAAAGVVGLYQVLSQATDNLISEDTSAQNLLGLQPRSVQQWLAEVPGDRDGGHHHFSIDEVEHEFDGALLDTLQYYSDASFRLGAFRCGHRH